jgi:pimeloyl-ACP methyl ester carboxylesterase
MLLSLFTLSAWPAARAAGLPAYKQEVVHMQASDGRDVAMLLTYPRSGMNTQTAALIHIQGGPGATPLEGSGPWIAEGMAARGYTTLQPEVRHAEDLFSAHFSDMDKDVKAAVDYLSNAGFHDIVLTGSSFGSITSTRYLVDTQDPRITANIHFSPTADMERSVPTRVGKETWQDVSAEADKLVSSNHGDTVFSYIFAHDADVWLDFWGPGSKGVNSMLMQYIKVPMLLLLGDQDGGIQSKETVEFQRASATSSPRADFIYYPGGVNHSLYPVHDKVLDDVVKWLGQIGLEPKAKTDVLAINLNEGKMGEGLRRGFLYFPEGKPESNGLAFLIVHDLTDDAFRGPSLWLGPALAEHGDLAMAVNVSPNPGGLMRATTKGGDADIKAWIDYLASLGATRVVLVGHGYGATRVTGYLERTGDRRVARIVDLAPTPDSAAWLKSAIGDAAYAGLVDKAHAALAAPAKKIEMQASNRTADSVQPIQASVDLLPLASPGFERLRIVAMPESFLEMWGPEAPALSSDTAKVKVPVLVVEPAKDPAAAQPSLQALLAMGSPVTVYRAPQPSDHAMLVEQKQVAERILSWSAAK